MIVPHRQILNKILLILQIKNNFRKLALYLITKKQLTLIIFYRTHIISQNNCNITKYVILEILINSIKYKLKYRFCATQTDIALNFIDVAYQT